MKEDVRILLDEVINDITSKHENSSPILNKMIFGYEHDFDFIYGQKVGMITGMIFGYYTTKYGDKPPESEFLEIVEAIQLKINDIKNSIKK